MGVAMADQAAPKAIPKATPVVIKRYANRRLYNAAATSYVTLEHLADMVKRNIDFVVYDVKTGEDTTRAVLTQIIAEEEFKWEQKLLPIPFLRQLVSFYGDSLQGAVPLFLEMSMQQFARHQEQMRHYLKSPFGFNALPLLDSMIKQNLAMFEHGMRLLAPSPVATPSEPPAAQSQAPGETLVPSEPTPSPTEMSTPVNESTIDDLKRNS